MRRQKLQMLGVTLANDFAVTEHCPRAHYEVCTNTLYTVRVLRTFGLSDAALQEVYRSVVVARLLYTASSWHGFTTASVRQQINQLLDRAKRYG